MVVTESGKEYYYNDETGQSVWEKPEGVDAAPTNPPIVTVSLSLSLAHDRPRRNANLVVRRYCDIVSRGAKLDATTHAVATVAHPPQGAPASLTLARQGLAEGVTADPAMAAAEADTLPPGNLVAHRLQ
jgi:hypothetical protein